MSFITPFFLFAAVTAILPVLYHLIRKMRAKTVLFSSLMFIKATPKELIKRRRLRDLILMLTRAAILGLLAFAFARPFIPREKIPFISQDLDRSKVILLDNSYSLQYENVFDKAKNEAIKIIDASGPNDEISIVLFSDKTNQLSELSKDKNLHKSVLGRSVKVSNHPTVFYNPVKLAEEILKDATNPVIEIILISDFQSSGWGNQFENWKVDQSITFNSVGVGIDNAENSNIDGFSSSISRNGDNVTAEMEVRVSTMTEGLLEGKNVSLTLNGDIMKELPLSITTGNRVFFRESNLRNGEYKGVVSIPADKLGIDDKYYFTFAVEAKPSILAVNNRESEILFLQNSFDLGEYSIYNFIPRGRIPFSPAVLKNQALVIVNNVSSLTVTQLTNAKKYVEDGGTLLISFGGRANLTQYRKYFEDFGIGRIDKKVVVRTIQRSEAIIAEVDLKHKIFAEFSNAGAADLFKPRFREYIRVIPDSNTVVLGSYDIGDPFLTETKFGKGSVLVYTSSLSTEWTDFPINEIFLPFLYQIAEYSSTNVKMRTGFIAGDQVPLSGEANENWEIDAPGDNLFKVTLDENGNANFENTEEPGNYTATNGKENYNFSVNIDTRESDLTNKDEDEVYSTVTRPANENTEEINEILAQNGINIIEEEKQQKFWKIIIILVIMLFIFETALANRKISVKL